MWGASKVKKIKKGEKVQEDGGHSGPKSRSTVPKLNKSMKMEKSLT